jgi:heme/copper-type cytochrome/quinol oxidase subunit 2
MKKTIIGGILIFTGTFISLAIILAAALFVPSITEWSGSKLWFAIFGAKQYGNEVVQSLFLGFPFVIGIMLFVIGFMVLVVEYFKKED